MVWRRRTAGSTTRWHRRHRLREWPCRLDARNSNLVTALQTTSDWVKRNPLRTILLFSIVATLVYFLGFIRLFVNGGVSTLVWAWQAWNPETNYEHAKLIPLIVVLLVWC